MEHVEVVVKNPWHQTWYHFLNFAFWTLKSPNNSNSQKETLSSPIRLRRRSAEGGNILNRREGTGSNQLQWRPQESLESAALYMSSLYELYELGRHISAANGDRVETSWLLQRIYVAIVRGSLWLLLEKMRHQSLQLAIN